MSVSPDDLQREFDSLNNLADGIRLEAELAGMRVGESVADVIRRLASERDDLLTSLEVLADRPSTSVGDDLEYAIWVHRTAADAIARATGQPQQQPVAITLNSNEALAS